MLISMRFENVQEYKAHSLTFVEMCEATGRCGLWFCEYFVQDGQTILILNVYL